MKFLIPQGIGDSVWAFHKIQDVAKKHGADRIDVLINCADSENEAERRALKFVRRFRFVDSAEMCKFRIFKGFAPDGRACYTADGETEIESHGKVFVLMPNGPLERGVRLENWLPEYDINWRVAEEYQFFGTDFEVADRFEKPYAVFYMGSLMGNTLDGHNRGEIWKPEDWSNLGDWLYRTYGLDIVLVGASYDMSYFSKKLAPLIAGNPWWHNIIGQCETSQTFAVCKRAKLVMSYQSGIGIMSHYLGVPVGIWWRADGDSMSPHHYFTLDERMANGWAVPDRLDQHLPLIYGRHDLEYIKAEIIRRKWLPRVDKVL